MSTFMVPPWAPAFAVWPDLATALPANIASSAIMTVAVESQSFATQHVSPFLGLNRRQSMPTGSGAERILGLCDEAAAV